MNDDEQHPHFSEFADTNSEPLEGTKRKIADILGKEILILNFTIKKSKVREGDYATIQFQQDGSEKNVIFTSSGPIMEQLERHKDQMPYYTTIVQRYKYFTMS